VSKVRASILHVGGFRPTLDPAASNFGMQPLVLPGEEWPAWEGKPLLFVCQMNLAAAPIVPELLAGIALLTFFINPDLGNLSEENGRDWRVRAYSSVEGMVPLAIPGDAPRARKGFECRWEEADDFRTASKNVARTKIGGFPSSIQGECWWDLKNHTANPKYCLQINSEEKPGLIWGDGGTIYVARGTAAGCEDRWFLDWHCF
jgi:uncharacterized protein YwqG